MIVLNYLSRPTFSSSLCLILFWSLIISLICIRFPGDPEKITYIDEVPPMLPPTLDFTGAVTYHFLDKDVGIRMFGIDLSMFKEKQGSQVYTECCRILCMIDEGSPRWKSYGLPPLNRVLHVTGLIHGFYKAGSRLSVCVIISELSYVSLSSPAPVVSPNNASASSSPSQGRLKIWSGVTASPLASKKRRLSASEHESSTSTTLPEEWRSESPTPSILTQLQTTVEETTHESVGTKPKRRIHKKAA